MSEAPILSVELIMSAGLKRISAIAEKHGINSPETLAACERWGGILDDINHPDSSCRWCGQAVTYVSGFDHYVHRDASGPDFRRRYCWSNAPAVATPAKVKKQVIRK